MLSRHQPIVLNKAIEGASPAEVRRALDQLRLAKAGEDLYWANDLAARRSGARGKDARTEQLKAEEAYRVAQAKCVSQLLTATQWSADF